MVDTTGTPQNAENHASAIWRKHSENIYSARSREWCVCRLLANKYSKDWTLAIPEDDRQRMRAAWVILEIINQHDPAEALTIRRNYGHRRIIEAGAKWKRLEFEVQQLIEFIKSDLPTSAMCAEIENQHGFAEWERRVFGVYKNISKLVDDYGAAQWVKDWAKDSKELFKSNGIEL